MRTKLGRSLLLIVFLCATFVPAASGSAQVRQVSYSLQFVELSTTDVKILGIESAVEPDLSDFSAGSITGFIHSPNLIQILQTAGNLMQFAWTNETNQTARVAEPHLTVAVGERGKFSLAHEEWIANRGERALNEHLFGLELLISPVQVSQQGDLILTDLELKTVGPKYTLLTSVWTKSGVFEPIGVLSYELRTQEQGLLRSLDKSETRYFAVYLQVQPITNLPQTPSVNIGSLGGLPKLLWQQEPLAKRSIAQINLPVKPVGWPELELGLWLTQSFRAEFVSVGSDQYYHFDLGSALKQRQDLTLHLQLMRNKSYNYLALGARDQVKIEPWFTISAGLYPVVFDLQEKKLAKGGYWWGEVELNQNHLSGSVNYTKKLERSYWQGTVGYRVSPLDLVFVSYKTDLDNLKQVFVGFRKEF